jgi:hypothetical protein
LCEGEQNPGVGIDDFPPVVTMSAMPERSELLVGVAAGCHKLSQNFRWLALHTAVGDNASYLRRVELCEQQGDHRPAACADHRGRLVAEVVHQSSHAVCADSPPIRRPVGQALGSTRAGQIEGNYAMGAAEVLNL